MQSIPECMGLIALSLALSRVPLRWGYIVAGGIIVSLIPFVIRALPVTFGLHLPICIFIIFLLIIKLTYVSPSRAVITVFSSFFVLALLEYIVSSVFFTLTDMDPHQAISNEGLWAAIGVFQSLILNFIALAIAYFLKPIKESWKK